MATGRTVIKFTRTYYDGYDISGYERTIGPLACTFQEVDATVITDAVKGFLPGLPNITPGNYSGVFAKASAGDIVSVGDAGKGLAHELTVAIGIRAAPAAGDPVFCGSFGQKAFTAAIDKAGGVTVAMPFGGWSEAAASTAYSYPWGKLQHALAAETAVNTAIGMDWGAASALGGFAIFHLMSSNGTVALKVQHSTTTNLNASFSDLLSSGNLDATSTPQHIQVALAKTTTVGQYTRWNLTLGSATTATFVISFVRSIM